MSVWGDMRRRADGLSDRKEDFLEMEYHKAESGFFEILAKKSYKDVNYVCISRGTHPCAYVFCGKEFLDNHSDEWGGLDCISVHGGVTFTGQANTLVGLSDYPDDIYCFGWDYAHASDWDGNFSESENAGLHKYTTGDIINECENAITQYLEALETESKTNEL